MKFGHLLKTFEADAAPPDTVCLNYKKLKKLIKAQSKHQQQQQQQQQQEQQQQTAPPPAVPLDKGSSVQPAQPAATSPPLQEQAGGIAEEDREFVNTLSTDLSRVNSYFMEKEEDAVIRLRALEDRLAAAREGLAAPELEQLRNEMVDFHGELVLMMHWSLVNYAAVAKILKKHDKLTGSRLRAPVLASVLHQPFLSTESISQLVKEAERHVQELTALCGAAAAGISSGGESGEGVSEPEASLSGSHVAIYKRTRAALHMVKEMQETASTPSTLLPPPGAAASESGPDGKKQKKAAQADGAAAALAAD